jgi:FtsP/CotA-like multicopper oxidase with cupredoxin domain
MRSVVSVWRDHRRTKAFIFLLAPTLLTHPAHAEDSSPLNQPPVCSAATDSDPALEGNCEVMPLADGTTVKVKLIANTSSIKVGGYNVVTEHYNRSYLTPVVEAAPGDTVAAHLENRLGRSDGHDSMTPGDANENPTNLHYFHGGIVSPHNARPPIDASQGNGDNIYVHLKNGTRDAATPYSFDFKVAIPGKNKLDARVLDGTGYIEHPVGLNWYHSHLHGISSNQVMGGMSGLLSVGDAKANVMAACEQDLDHPGKCKNDIEKDTLDLKQRTDAKYVLLRDIPLQSISALPDGANDATAKWAPQVRDFPEGTKCAVWKKVNGQLIDDGDKKQRKGFCQRDQTSAWLFTLNGQRFPTITIEGNRNVLLRTGNLSANVAYWLELYNESDEKDILPLEILSLDGVVPAKPVNPAEAKIPVKAEFKLNDLLLMPATRAEIYVRNDFHHTDPRVYVLRTKGPDAGTDEWPEIQLARIVLEPNLIASTSKIALNAPIEQPPLFAAPALAPEVTLPKGCVRDLKPEKSEHRRVSFVDLTTNGKTLWGVKTEIVHPPKDDPAGKHDERSFEPSEKDDSTDKTTISHRDDGSAVPFKDYELKDGSIDWEGERTNHVCIRLDHVGSHDQLWVLWNTTGALHNFHIHQIKFRLAKGDELEARRIKLPSVSVSPCDSTFQQCPQPEYKLYETDNSKPPEWHDTIPIPPGQKVFIIMSFDAQEQVGRFVYHCHILKHEDAGLMAPIEVWDPHPALVDR